MTESQASATYVISVTHDYESKHAPNSEIINGIPNPIAFYERVTILSSCQSLHCSLNDASGSPLAQTLPPSWQQYE